MVTVILKSPAVRSKSVEGVSYVREGDDFPGKEEEGREKLDFSV